MEKREQALTEALQKNSEEVEKWERYINENTDAINNMKEFVKHVDLQVMVPIGRKALMFGQLIHTNEVLVGHYQGYFSECSVSKAIEICDLRISKAKTHLEKLEVERNLWRNNLEKPYVEGALPSDDLQEIIEKYDEEAEILWRQQHKINVRKAKLKEIEQRENAQHDEEQISSETKCKTDEEIFKMLELAELEEELKQELENLEINEVSDETIKQLMNAEPNLPSKPKRIAHNAVNENTDNENPGLRGVVKVTKTETIEPETLRTNNNIQPNPELSEKLTVRVDNDDEEDDALSKEFEMIKKQMQYLKPVDQLRFLEFQIDICQQRISLLKINSNEDICEKVKLLTILDKLEDRFEIISDDVDVDVEELEENKDIKVTDRNNSKTLPETHPQKKKISFNLENRTLEFDNRQPITEMIARKVDRDVIKLDDDDDDDCITNDTDKIEMNTPDRESLRTKKLEDNLEYVKENQSRQDFDLVGQILKESNEQILTLHIHFQHSISENESVEKQNHLQMDKDTHDHPITPGDIYEKYLSYLKQKHKSDGDSGANEETQMKIPLLKEVDRPLAYRDPKIEFSTPSCTLQTKSILRKTTHADGGEQFSSSNAPPTNASKNPYKIRHKTFSNHKKPFYSVTTEDNEGLSAYYKVMHDVTEKPSQTDKPGREARCIDTHAPRKRISRFKQIRQAT